MAGTTTGADCVEIKSGDSENKWVIDSSGHGQVDIVAMPNVVLEGSNGTVVKVTANGSLHVTGSGGSAGTAVSINADGNVWEINSSRAGTVRLVSENDTPVHVTANGSIATIGSGGGGGGGGNVTVIFGGNTWEIDSSGRGPVDVQGETTVTQVPGDQWSVLAEITDNVTVTQGTTPWVVSQNSVAAIDGNVTIHNDGNVWEINSTETGKVRIVSQNDTPVHVTSNGSIATTGSGGGGGSGGNVTVVFGANTWEINSSNAGLVMPRTANDTPMTAAPTLTHGLGGVYVAQGLPNPLGAGWTVTPTTGSTIGITGETTVTQVAGDTWAVEVADHAEVTHLLSGLNTSWNSTVKTSNSASFSCADYLYFTLAGVVTVSGAPTDIQFNIQFKSDGNGTWIDYREDFWADVRWSDTAVSQSRGGELKFALDGRCIMPKIRAWVTATGTGTTNNFETSDMILTLKA